MKGFAGGAVDKNLSANEGEAGSITGWEDPTCHKATEACVPEPHSRASGYNKRSCSQLKSLQ